MSSNSDPIDSREASNARPTAESTTHSAASLRWYAVFGPGAIIASLTIGAGELIFSTRAGALFGYRLLWFFTLILLLKWALVFATARHMVISGFHPMQRWIKLPGPAGWLNDVFLMLGMIAFPIWVSFHAGTMGTLIASLLGWETAWRGTAHLLCGFVFLAGVLCLILSGGYARLERLQVALVLLMLASVLVSLFILQPDWLEMAKGLFVPQPLVYPEWIHQYPEVAARPIWVETITYVGVVGGSGYDYLAYVSYLRDKNWGRAGHAPGSADDADAGPSSSRWIKIVCVDCTLSFAAVLVFAAVFVACGALVLAPQGKIPAGTNLLVLQAEFVTPIYPWLKYLYFTGAFLAMLGTLYGTIEVAPAVYREWMFALRPHREASDDLKVRRNAVLWAGAGGMIVLLGNALYGFLSGQGPLSLVTLLTPANLFTGVLSCGVICLLSLWADRRFLKQSQKMNGWIFAANAVGALFFLALGLKAYWDHSGGKSLLILLGTLGAGWVLAANRRKH